MINKVFNEDCLIGMQRIPSGSVDMILCDLPYGTTAIASINTGRKYIGFETDEEYYKIINSRIEETLRNAI